MKHNTLSRIIGDSGQWLSVFIMSFGVYLFFTEDIDSGTLLFSFGCLVNVLATKYKYYADEYIKRNREILDIVDYKLKCYDNKEKIIVVDDNNIS